MEIRAVGEILVYECRRLVIIAGGNGLPVRRHDVDVRRLQQIIDLFEIFVCTGSQDMVERISGKLLDVFMVGYQGREWFKPVQVTAQRRNGEAQRGLATLISLVCISPVGQGAAVGQYKACSQKQQPEPQPAACNVQSAHRTPVPLRGQYSGGSATDNRSFRRQNALV